MVTRRHILLGAGALGACAYTPKHEARLAAIEARVGGRLGIAALDTQTRVRISHRASERFAMCSTFKAPLAAAILKRVERGDVRLDQRVALRAEDLLDYAPAARAHLAEGAMTVEALCAGAVGLSDNTAANLLLGLIGGPAGLTSFLRACGDRLTRLDRTEPTLNTNLPGDPRDTTTPAAMCDTLASVLTSDRVLAKASRDHLTGWLENSQTGRERLRAGLPPSWRVGDKTGTGARGAAHDIAIAWPPGRAPIIIASYLEAPDASADARNAAHAEAARVVASIFAA